MRIVIAGDLLPQECNMDLFEQGKVDSLFGDGILNLFRLADLRICNLEGALTDSVLGIEKSGPCIKATPESIHGIKALGIDCVSIANNHIMDYGAEGYLSTLAVLNKQGIKFVGGGADEISARKPIVFEIDGLRIGVYSCAEYEFTIASENRPGANAFDALYVLDDIACLKTKSDYVIAIYHGTKEYYRYPIPYVQKRCRRMVEKGADLVLCQHSHCVGCREIWGNGEILYGQGNFIFHREDNEYCHTGLLASVEINDGRMAVEYHPVVRGAKNVRLAEGAEKQAVLDDFENRSQQIKHDGFVENRYQEFADGMLRQYYNMSLGRFAIIPRALRKMGFKSIYKVLYTRYHKLALLNNLRCEAHRDIFVKGLLGDLGEDY